MQQVREFGLKARPPKLSYIPRSGQWKSGLGQQAYTGFSTQAGDEFELSLGASRFALVPSGSERKATKTDEPDRQNAA